jgi:hypothetical protein
MSTAALTTERAAPRALRRPRLVSAELLKLRKRRGLVLAGLALTVLPMVVAYTVLVILHAANPAKHGPAGGLDNLSGSLDLLSTLGGVAAILIGTTLGAGDLSSGVFRELVVTGRSRLSLYAARVPAGLVLVWALAGAGFAITATGSTVFAGSLQAPGAALLVKTAAWLALAGALSLLLALGVSSVVGSRGVTIGIVLGWQIVLAPLLLHTKTLGSLREGLLAAAIERLAPGPIFDGPPTVAMSIPAVVVVVAAWAVVPLALGAWRTCRRDV